MKQVSNISIRKEREAKENENVICIREINKNLRNIEEGKPLTRPLRILNNSCEFKKRYYALGKIEDELNGISYRQLYNERPEIKKKMKEYQKKYYKRSGVKERKIKYNRKYNQRPEVKEKLKEYRKEYYKRLEVKEKRREKNKKRKEEKKNE